jgi:hypothetical protein
MRQPHVASADEHISDWKQQDRSDLKLVITVIAIVGGVSSLAVCAFLHALGADMMMGR